MKKNMKVYTTGYTVCTIYICQDVMITAESKITPVCTNFGLITSVTGYEECNVMTESVFKNDLAIIS